MNNFYRFLRCAALMFLMMAIPTVMIGNLPAITTTNGTHLYKINLAENTSGYLSGYFITPSSPKVSIDDNPGANELWYIIETDDTPTGTFTRPHINHYCYIVNAVSGQYLYYTGTNSNNIEANVVEMKYINDEGVENDRFKFIIKQSGNGSTENYWMFPKIAAENNQSNNNSSNLWESNSNGFLALGIPQGSTYANDITLSKERNGVWTSQWVFVSSSLLAAPTITFNSGNNTFSISHNTLTSGCTIYYTLDGSTPSTASTHYSGPVNVNVSETVKAVVIRDYDNIVLTEVGSLEVAPVAVAAPTVTNNFDGTISLSTATIGATIYYTINGDTPDNTSTAYSSTFSLGNATVIKAIAYLGSESSDVTTYNVPKYHTPTITFNNSTSKVTITSEGTVYYNTGDGSQDDPTTSSGTLYSEPFTVSSPITVKAIATHAGYLTSDVATKYILSNNYSHNYLTFNVISSGTICWKAFGSLTKTISYRINGGSWEEITSTSAGATFDVNEDDVVEFKGSNTTYATSNSAYSGFEGGTATFDIEGNIHSLLYGYDFADNNSLTNSTYQFCSLFKKANVISAKNLILPATTLTNYCYRALFSWCTTLEEAPVLPATTLATGCYWYMFERCAISSAPELNATTLAQECYGHMFEGCGSLNYVKCMATSGFDKSNCLLNWVLNVSSTGTFVKETNTTWSSGASGIPSNWTIYNDYLLYSPEISCDGEYITITCATPEASIYYRLNQTGDFLPYSLPISINETTFVEAYSHKGSNTSNIVSDTFVIYDNPFDESTRSLDNWTFGNHQVTSPYSVNGIDGHSSNYSKGNHTFETTVTLYKVQTTYLWFQHADQSADIYVDDVFVTTHWGGYNAFFVDISSYVHVGTNRIKVVLNNTTRNTLAPYAGDFNFNATLGKVKLLTSPIMPSMDYGYDGFHITSTVSNASATINIKTKIPVGANVICKIDADAENYHFSDTKASTGDEMTFTTTISNPHLWNGTVDPFLYDVTLEIYDNVNNELYHRYQRPYGFRYYDYDPSIGFRLNGSPYLLRGVCTHHDLEGKANALDDADIANDFAIIQELGCNFVRLAHYPHPKEVYDWCDRLGIIVQTEVPCVNKFQNSLPQDYYDHLYIQYDDMVRQHYNHPCIMFWGLFNEATTDDTSIAKTRLEAYKTFIKNIDPERWVGYVVSHSSSNPSSLMGNPDMDWFGCNIYVGWYIDKTINDPTNQLNKRVKSTITDLSKPLAFSEYGCGGTPSCHSDDFMTTTTTGNNPRHDIEYQMWLHEGHIAAIKNKPELLFTSQWQLFDIAVSSRNEGYTICPDGINASIDNNLRYLNNKGLVERDHKTKKDTYYLYKAWWNQTDKFVHICGKNYEKYTDRVIKCYTNDGNTLRLYVNDALVESVAVENNIATFAATTFHPGDVIRVSGATTNDTFTITNIFRTDGNWGETANWSCKALPVQGCDVIINAECTIPDGVVARANNITIGENGSLTIADGGQLILPNNTSVQATVQNSTVASTETKDYVSQWNAISSPVNNVLISSFVQGTHNVYRYDEETVFWQEYRNSANAFAYLQNGRGYIYRSTEAGIEFSGDVTTGDANGLITCPDLSYACENDKYKGFNLIGNPFTHDITWANLTTTTNISDAGYFLLGANGEWAAQTASGTIAPMQAFMIQATDADPVVKIANSVVSAKGNDNRYGNDQIQFTVNNSEYSDVAYAIFKEGYGLNKIEHRNADIPMLYIINNNQDFAIAAMPDNTSVIGLGFNATKMGQYTLSVKAEGQYSYMHLFDKLTGNDIDMLLDDSYTFIGSSTDRKDRFLLRLNYNAANIDTESDIFAYQNGSDIIVSGEGELQIFDITGRQVMTTAINGVEPINVLTQGVYILRLVGTEIRTQKIIIK